MIYEGYRDLKDQTKIRLSSTFSSSVQYDKPVSALAS